MSSAVGLRVDVFSSMFELFTVGWRSSWEGSGIAVVTTFAEETIKDIMIGKFASTYCLVLHYRSVRSMGRMWVD